MTNGNDMAFPNVVTDAEGNNVDYEKGLTKREYFAAMAMQGLMARGDREAIKMKAVLYADALIDKLNQP